MSAFRHYGLEVVVDVSKQAVFDFAAWQIAASERDNIARNLKTVPSSPRDRFRGQLRVREIGNWDVFFTFVFSDQPTIVIVAIEPKGATETLFDYVVRASIASLPPAVQELLKGRRRKDE